MAHTDHLRCINRIGHEPATKVLIPCKLVEEWVAAGLLNEKETTTGPFDNMDAILAYLLMVGKDHKESGLENTSRDYMACREALFVLIQGLAHEHQNHIDNTLRKATTAFNLMITG